MLYLYYLQEIKVSNKLKYIFETHRLVYNKKQHLRAQFNHDLNSTILCLLLKGNCAGTAI